MSGKLTRIAYRQLIAEDIGWLEALPRTLERDHIISIVRESERYYYEDAQDEAIREARERALRPLEDHEILRLDEAFTRSGPLITAETVDAILDRRKAHP